jgi:hypothetical protein
LMGVNGATSLLVSRGPVATTPVNLLRTRSLNSQMPLRSVHFVLVVGKYRQQFWRQ